MERPNPKCMSRRKLERITHSLHTGRDPCLLGVTLGRWRDWLPGYNSSTRTQPPQSASDFVEFLDVSACSLFCLVLSLTCCRGSPSHALQHTVCPGECVHCRPTNWPGSTTALKHSEAMKMMQSEWCYYCHASILYFLHSERHLSAS